jgi:L-ribulose-5-phosphate 4-epimerase
MRLKSLREQVYEANLEVVRRGLVLYTWGNASGIDRDEGLVVIKPSGVPYEKLTPENLCVVDLEGRVIEGSFKPSSDLDTHLVLYEAFKQAGGVVHTHSKFATIWAQAKREIPCLGTTHADYFYGAIPVTDPLTDPEVAGDYELNTGVAIVRRFKDIDPLHMPAVLVANHGPFAWGKTAAEAAHNAVVLEEVAFMALQTYMLEPAPWMAQNLLDRHFFRKHGPGATYGQGSGGKQ